MYIPYLNSGALIPLSAHGLFSNKWERYWYVLKRTGDLMWFNHPQEQWETPRAVDKTVVYAAVLGIKVGENVST